MRKRASAGANIQAVFFDLDDTLVSVCPATTRSSHTVPFRASTPDSMRKCETADGGIKPCASQVLTSDADLQALGAVARLAASLCPQVELDWPHSSL